jgi:STE24 endopeptidase
MNWFTLLFVAALFAGLTIELWLLQRHRRHVLTHRDRVPRAFSDSVTLAEHQKAADYTIARGNIGRIEIVFGALLLLVWTLGGGINAVAALWGNLQLDPLFAGSGLILSVSLISSLLTLPFSVWSTFGVESRFGFNRTTVKRFLVDRVLHLALFLLFGVPLTLTILWILQVSGTYWWLFAWLVWTGFTLFVTWIYPTLIAPLFNRFQPLPDEHLLQRLEALLKRCGFSSKGVFVMDGSRRSSHGNAYFTGFGRSKRIVFFDTLLEILGHDEIEAVLAHELGHFKRHHVRKGMALMMLSSLAGLALLGWLMEKAWFFTGLGVSEQTNATALLLFLLVSPVFTFFLQPLLARYQRKHEFEADNFAADQTGAEPMIASLVKLYRENASTLTPDPLYSAFHDSHPPAPIRISNLSSR